METSDHDSGFSDPQISRIEIHKVVKSSARTSKVE